MYRWCHWYPVLKYRELLNRGVLNRRDHCTRIGVQHGHYRDLCPEKLWSRSGSCQIYKDLSEYWTSNITVKFSVIKISYLQPSACTFVNFLMLLILEGHLHVEFVQHINYRSTMAFYTFLGVKPFSTAGINTNTKDVQWSLYWTLPGEDTPSRGINSSQYFSTMNACHAPSQ